MSSKACTRAVCFGLGWSAAGIRVAALRTGSGARSRRFSTTGSTGEAMVTQIRLSLPRAMLSG